MLDDYTTAPIDEKLRATLGLLKQMTLEHDRITAEDVRTVMRGPSDWSVGERELFAAFVSRLNQCHF